MALGTDRQMSETLSRIAHPGSDTEWALMENASTRGCRAEGSGTLSWGPEVAAWDPWPCWVVAHEPRDRISQCPDSPPTGGSFLCSTWISRSVGWATGPYLLVPEFSVDLSHTLTSTSSSAIAVWWCPDVCPQMLPQASLPGLAPTSDLPAALFHVLPPSDLSEQQNPSPGVSCQQMARTSPASIRPPAVQALSLLPSSILNRATGMLSQRSTQHRTQRASVHHRAHKRLAHWFCLLPGRAGVQKLSWKRSAFLLICTKMSLGWEEAVCWQGALLSPWGQSRAWGAWRAWMGHFWLWTVLCIYPWAVQIFSMCAWHQEDWAILTLLTTIALLVSGVFLSAYKQAQVSPTGTKPVRLCTCLGFCPRAPVQKQHQATRQDRIQEDRGPVMGTVSVSPITTSLRNLAVTLIPRIPLPIVCNYTLLDNSVLQFSPQRGFMGQTDHRLQH